jgi:hypothetical protein
MKPHYKEYNFTGLINLSEDLREIFRIITPFEPEIGEKTRNLILDKFIRSIGEGFYLCNLDILLIM